MEYNFVELPKFTKELKSCKSLVDKWIYFIKNAPNLNVIPAGVKDEGLKHAYEDADRHNWTKEELEAYLYAEMRRQDEKGKMEVAVRKAVAKASENATKLGREQREIEIVKKMILLNVDKEIILQSTGLSMETLLKLINELK